MSVFSQHSVDPTDIPRITNQVFFIDWDAINRSLAALGEIHAVDVCTLPRVHHTVGIEAVDEVLDDRVNAYQEEINDSLGL